MTQFDGQEAFAYSDIQIFYPSDRGANYGLDQAHAEGQWQGGDETEGGWTARAGQPPQRRGK